MAKTRQAISHAVTSFALLIALLIILVLMVTQTQNQQTTSSEASEMMGTGTCRPYLAHATVRSLKGKCGVGVTQYIDFTCNGDPYRLNRTMGSMQDCRSAAEWTRRAEEFCKNKFKASETVCTKRQKPQPTHGIQPQ